MLVAGLLWLCTMTAKSGGLPVLQLHELYSLKYRKRYWHPTMIMQLHKHLAVSKEQDKYTTTDESNFLQPCTSKLQSISVIIYLGHSTAYLTA